ncbi:MAG: hypothetical protein ACI8TQ_001613, partial [Planctomycetota bacterium]
RIGPHRTEVALPPLAFTPTNPNKQREKNQKPAAGSKPKPSLDKFTPEQIAAYRKKRAAQSKKGEPSESQVNRPSRADSAKSKPKPAGDRSKGKNGKSLTEKYTPEQIEAYKKKRAQADADNPKTDN